MSNNALAFLQILFSVDRDQLARSDRYERDAEQRFSVLRLLFSVGEEQLVLIRIAANVLLNDGFREQTYRVPLSERRSAA